MNWGIAPGPPLQSILESTAKINIWEGPIRSAKTTHSLIRWLEHIYTAPQGGALLMAGLTLDTLERNALRPLNEAMPSFQYSVGQRRAYYANREIDLMGANDRTAESKARGGNIAGFYGDELTLQPIDFLKQVFQRLSLEGSRAFGATNPDSPFHPLKTEFLDRQADLKGIVKSFHWDIEKNIFLRPDYIAELKRLYPEGSLWYKRFILGLWVAAEGAIYDQWNDETHRLKQEPSLEPEYLAVSCDYGTQNPFAAGLYPVYRRPLSIHPFAKLLTYCQRSYYYDGRANQKQKTDSEYAQNLIDWLDKDAARVELIIVDPSATSFKAELRKTLQIKNKGHIRVKDAKNDVDDGIRTVSRMLHSGALRIGPDKSNDKLVQELTGYRWDPKAQAKGEDKPLKVNDHHPDQLRYLCMTLFGNEVTGNSSNLYM